MNGIEIKNSKVTECRDKIKIKEKDKIKVKMVEGFNNTVL